MTEYSERDLILPALDIINRKPGVATAELIVELEDILSPDGEDIVILKGRSDTKFSQKVRNLVSHHTIDQYGLGYIKSEHIGKNWYHTITVAGKSYLDQYSSDEVEGADIDVIGENVDESATSPDYQIDSVIVRAEQRTVFEVMRRIQQGGFVLEPEFQRGFVWNEFKQSRLIESVLMRIPLPVFYLAEQEDGRVVVVDGLQRLKTFERYLKNEFPLQLPKARLSIHGSRFADLPFRYQQRIEDTPLAVYLVDSKVSEKIRLDIFDRVNSGTPLSRQQMRNAIYTGQATRWLKEEAVRGEFLKATGKSLSSKSMRDREVINRFCAFLLCDDVQSEYTGDMDDFLAETLKKMNKMSPDQLEEMSGKFRRSMANNYYLFEKHAFRRHTRESTSRSVINIALFDVLSVYMVRFDVDYVAGHADKMRDRFYELMESEDFKTSISTSINALSTNSVTKVRARFKMIQEAYKDL